MQTTLQPDQPRWVPHDEPSHRACQGVEVVFDTHRGWTALCLTCETPWSVETMPDRFLLDSNDGTWVFGNRDGKPLFVGHPELLAGDKPLTWCAVRVAYAVGSLVAQQAQTWGFLPTRTGAVRTDLHPDLACDRCGRS